MILWINLVTNGLPALALGIDPPDPTQMMEPPRKATEGLLGAPRVPRHRCRRRAHGRPSRCALYVLWPWTRRGPSSRARDRLLAARALAALPRVELPLRTASIFSSKPLVASPLCSRASRARRSTSSRSSCRAPRGVPDLRDEPARVDDPAPALGPRGPGGGNREGRLSGDPEAGRRLTHGQRRSRRRCASNASSPAASSAASRALRSASISMPSTSHVATIP